MYTKHTHIFRKSLIYSILCFLALNVAAQSRVLYEDFSSAKGSSPPSGWSYDLVSGNAKFDSFFFNNTKYVFAPSIQGNCAFFDVYNGGVQGASNGDGFYEDTYLITPFVNLDTTKDWTLAFDYHFMRLRSPVFAVLWRPNASTPWSRIWEDRSGAELTSHIEIQVFPGSAVKGKGQFAFNWQTTNNALTQGYLAIDNIEIYTKAKFDVRVLPDPLNRTVFCNDDVVDISFVVQNFGTSDVNLTPVKLKISYPLKDTVVLDTIKSIAKGQSISYSADAKYKFRPGYNYTIELVTAHLQDAVHFNDTAFAEIIYLDTLQKPNVKDVERCGNGTVDLFALTHLDDTTFWFDRNNVIQGKGKMFTTPLITADDTFIVRSSKLFSGKVNTYQGLNGFSTPSSGGAFVRVIANEHMVIHSLGQHFRDKGSFKADIYYKKGDYKGHESDSSAWSIIASIDGEAGGWGEFTKLPVKLIELFENDTASFCLAIRGNAPFTFKRVHVSIDVPSMSVFSDRVTNKRFVSGGKLYTGLSWDGEIHYWTVCTSEPDSVAVRIISRPKGVTLKAGTGFNGLFKAGTYSNPDQISEKGQVVYDITGPSIMTNKDYGKLWVIDNINVTTSGGVKVPDSLYYFVPPLFNIDYKLVFTPKGWLTDSTIAITFTVFDLTNGCDTSITRIVQVSLLPAPWFLVKEVCTGNQMFFEVEAKTINQPDLTYKWDFGDGTTSKGSNQVKVYNTAGKYKVKLTATNSFGISASVTREVNVLSRPRPLIDAKFACEGEPIHLEALRIKSSEKITWLIDGQRINDSVTVEHIYNSPGTYFVNLIASNVACADTVGRNVFQFHRPEVTFSAEGRCNYDTFLLFSNVKYSGEGNLGYKWLLNDQLFSTTKDWKGVMPESGGLSVKLITASQFQCSDTFTKMVSVLPSPKANFDVGLACFDVETKFYNKTKDTAGLNVKYQWSFGDGRFSTDINPVNNYQNTGETLVALRATANNGCSDRKDSLVIVKVKPNAKFSFSGSCDGQGVVFTNFSEQSDGTLHFEWDFGDGYTSALHSPVHAYRVEKTTTFIVNLRVYTDYQGCSDIYTEPVTISVNPVCEFRSIRSATDRAVWKFEPVELDSQNHDYTWVFVGSGVSTDASPVHKFEYTESDYSVILNIKNSEGCECFDSSNTVRTSWGLGFNQVKNSGITVFPNPATDVLNIAFDESVTAVPDQLRLTDIAGRIVMTEQLNKVTSMYKFDVSGINKGVYILICTNNSGQSIEIPVIISR